MSSDDWNPMFDFEVPEPEEIDNDEEFEDEEQKQKELRDQETEKYLLLMNELALTAGKSIRLSDIMRILKCRLGVAFDYAEELKIFGFLKLRPDGTFEYAAKKSDIDKFRKKRGYFYRKITDIEISSIADRADYEMLNAIETLAAVGRFSKAETIKYSAYVDRLELCGLCVVENGVTHIAIKSDDVEKLTKKIEEAFARRRREKEQDMVNEELAKIGFNDMERIFIPRRVRASFKECSVTAPTHASFDPFLSPMEIFRSAVRENKLWAHTFCRDTHVTPERILEDDSLFEGATIVVNMDYENKEIKINLDLRKPFIIQLEKKVIEKLEDSSLNILFRADLFRH